MMEAEFSGYQVQTEFFAGPLDLLLHLIRKNKMNIVEVRLSQITAEYLSYLEGKRGINPSRESEFLMTAATLIYIKSRTLLPKPESPDEESPEKQLIHTLIEYEKIQKISKLLQEMEYTELLLWRRLEMNESFANREYELKEVSAFQLAEIFFDIVKKKEYEQFLEIPSKNYSIAKKQEEFLLLLESSGYIDFSEYVSKLFGTISIYKNTAGKLEN
jgi:segregation and condensation protein A